jgi:catechol 2,3-dioxygenase-like lactoylglutathione lyase family enzyme
MIKDSNTTIMVKDLEQSVSFYESIGFIMKNRWGNHYAQLSASGMTIGLHPTENPVGNSGNVSLGFTSEDFENTKRMLQECRISFDERNEEGGQFIHFTDPDGTALYFIQPKW